MIILGIDPGVISTGYGAIKTKDGKESLVDFGVITIERERELPARLSGIYDGITALCRKLQPDALAIEEIFFSKNARTAITVGHTSAAVILAAGHQGVEVSTYTPLQIKQMVSGYGRADKTQMQRIVQVILKLEKVPQPDHAADALAVALCHYYISRTTPKLKATKWSDNR